MATEAEGLNIKKLQTLSANCVLHLKGACAVLFAKGTPADIYLKKVFRENHKFGSRDRHMLTKAVFAYFRWACRLTKVFGYTPLDAETPGKETTRLLAAAFLCEGECPPVAEVWCRECGISFPDYQAIFTQAQPEARLETFCGRSLALKPADLLPDWVCSELADGAETKYIPYLTTRPPVWIRLQTRTAKEKEHLLQEFEANGIHYTEHGSISGALKLDEHAKVNLYQLAGYRNGLFEVQDLASQCIGLTANPEPGSGWWDVCAGSGGKSLQLAMLMGDKGSVLATDLREKCREEVEMRAKRGRFRCIHAGDLEAAHGGQYDGVLVDAPCSSSGRWRRNPEMKLVATPDWIGELAETQYMILEKASGCVKPGGLLIYGTCSVFTRENTGVVRRFLASHPDFVLDKPLLSPHTGLPSGGMIQSFPADADCDGTFAARMCRLK